MQKGQVLPAGCGCGGAGRKAARREARARKRAASRRLLLYGVDEVRAVGGAELGLDGPVIAERVAQLEGVELLGEALAVAHVEARREVAAEDEGGLVREGVGLEAHVRDADAITDALG